MITGWFRRWPSANVGIRTGAESGLVALDVDPRHGGDASLEELQRRHGRLPDTLTANTGGGGRHILFGHPGGVVGNPTRLAGLKGLDVRGDGGYIVAAPSTHVSGGSYTWAEEPSLASVTLAPDWFCRLANVKTRATGSIAVRGGAITTAAIPEGKRNERLFSLGARLRREGQNRDGILGALLAANESRCQPPLDSSEVEQIADNAAARDAGQASDAFQLIAPLPEATPEPDTEHPQLGPSVSSHVYQDRESRDLWRVCTYWDQQELVSRPLTLWEGPGGPGWRWKGPPPPRPLFRLPEIVAQPTSPILVLAHEAAAERAAAALPTWTTTCPMFGGNGVGTADWAPVAGRDILVWAADNTKGRAFARLAAEAARRAGAARVAIFGHDRRPGGEDSITAAGRLDGGDFPSPDSGWTEAHLKLLFDEGAASAPTPAEQVNVIRDNEDKLPGHRLNQEIAQYVRDDLLRRGQLYHEGDVAYVFLSDQRLLVELDAENPNFVRLLASYGINRSESPYMFVANQLWVEATTNGVKTTVRYLSHYDKGRNAIYVYNQGGLIYKITTAGIDTVENGADGVLFLGEPLAEPFHLVDEFDPDESDDDGLSPIRRLLADGLSLAPGLLTRDDALMLLVVWLFGLFLPELMPTKPILALVGQRGSAKTAMAKRIGMMLFGRGFDVTTLTDDAKDFDAAASASALLVLDNVDTEKSWLPDKLATLATGGRLMKRVLYTTNQVAPFRARCWAVVTSRTPPFKRDDVAERLLLLRTERRETFVAQAELDRRTLEHRDLLMTNLLHELVGVAQALREHGAAEMVSDFRMADYYAFAMRVARHWGVENAMGAAFRRLQRAQGAFAVEDDPVAGLIEMWLRKRSNVGRQVGATELFNELSELARGARRPMADASPRAFSQRLAQNVVSLRERFNIKDTRRQKTAYYEFRPLPEV